VVDVTCWTKVLLSVGILWTYKVVSPFVIMTEISLNEQFLDTSFQAHTTFDL
jgi:hypothetical protein